MCRELMSVGMAAADTNMHDDAQIQTLMGMFARQLLRHEA